MNRSIAMLSRFRAALVVPLLGATLALPADAQRQKGIPLEKGGVHALRFPNLPRPPLSPAWEDPAAVERGTEMMARLIETAGGWDAFQALGGVRYDLLQTSMMDSGGKKGWLVHHYEPRLAHFNVDGSGYLYSEYAKPTLTGPDFIREVVVHEVSWREMRGGFGRSPKARRTARSSVRLECFTGLMPFSLRVMDAKMAFIEEEESAVGTLEEYAVQLAEPLMINYYPFMVDEFGQVDEFLVYVEPSGPRVVQMRFAFPDEMVERPPHLRWWTMDFEGSIAAGEEPNVVAFPHKRFRSLEGFNDVDELWIEDVLVDRIPPPAMRRPWLSDGVYQMPYRCDYWDPPDGVQGLTGHDTDIPLPRPGQYPPGHPRYKGPPPSLDDVDGAESDSGDGGGAADSAPVDGR
jgi:hypothetical protein